MNPRVSLLAMVFALVSSPAWAHGNEQHHLSKVEPGRETADAVQSITAESTEAVAALERFSAALSVGDLDAASVELDANVLILESGGAERTRAEYLGGHAKHDAEFLKSAHITLKRRIAGASGDLVWVGSESEIHASRDGKALKFSSTETAVLRRTSQGWKIVHLHWSSRAQE